MQNSEYNFSKIEPKWQKYWADKNTFQATDFDSRPKFYILDMFPYPSGAGLHIGHPEGYTASDAYKRFKKSQGYNVFTQWDGMLLVYQLSNMQLKRQTPRRNHQNKC